MEVVQLTIFSQIWIHIIGDEYIYRRKNGLSLPSTMLYNIIQKHSIIFPLNAISTLQAELNFKIAIVHIISN